MKGICRSHDAASRSPPDGRYGSVANRRNMDGSERDQIGDSPPDAAIQNKDGVYNWYSRYHDADSGDYEYDDLVMDYDKETAAPQNARRPPPRLDNMSGSMAPLDDSDDEQGTVRAIVTYNIRNTVHF